VSIKAVGIAIKLTIEGINQPAYFQIWLFVIVSATCIIILLVYLNKLGYCIKPFNTDVVYPIYYAMLPFFIGSEHQGSRHCHQAYN
jgi:hypothetical protein